MLSVCCTVGPDEWIDVFVELVQQAVDSGEFGIYVFFVVEREV